MKLGIASFDSLPTFGMILLNLFQQEPVILTSSVRQ